MNTETHYNLGVEYMRQGRLDDAVQEFLVELATNPNDPDVHNDLGVTYKRQGRLDDAIREFEIALRLNPKHENATMNLSVALKMKEALQSRDVQLAKQTVESIVERPVYFDGVIAADEASEPILVFKDCGEQVIFSPLSPHPETLFSVAGMQIRLPYSKGALKYLAIGTPQGWIVEVSASDGERLALLTNIPDQSVENGKLFVRALLKKPSLDLEFVKMAFDSEGANRKVYHSPIGTIELSTKRERGGNRGQVYLRDSGTAIDFFQHLPSGRVVISPKEQKPWWKFWKK